MGETKMNRQEFDELTTRKCTDEEYKVIEIVYAFHPSIDESKGKKQIATLFDGFGMRIIADMLPTAIKARGFQNDIQLLMRDLENKRNDYNDFRTAIDCTAAFRQPTYEIG